MLILVDQDGVQAGYAEQFDQVFRERYPDAPFVPHTEHTEFKLHRAYPEEWKERIQAIQREAGFFESLPPIAGAVEGMAELRAAGHDVRICTAPLRMSATCASEKFAWIRRYHGEEMLERVIITSDKTLVMGDVLVDDNPVIEGALEPVWDHVLYDQPYSRILGRPVFTWGPGLMDRLAEIEDERRSRGVLVHDRDAAAVAA